MYGDRVRVNRITQPRHELDGSLLRHSTRSSITTVSLYIAYVIGSLTASPSPYAVCVRL